jgi:hypothetical protein
MEAPGGAAAVQRPEWLYLFSSNRSPLYSQDILNVLAAPDGLHYKFRYDEEYVEDATAQAWETLQAGTRVLVVFSLQQAARFQPAVFMPIRLGKLVRTWKLGTRYFVEFALEKLVLPARAVITAAPSWHVAVGLTSSAEAATMSGP